MLRIDEGKRPRPYDCGTNQPIKAAIGHVTIGYGHNLDAKPLSDRVMEIILEEDIADALIEAKSYIDDKSVWESLSDNRKLAILNLCFNIGYGGIKQFVKLRRAIFEKDWKQAGLELQNSLWARQVDTKNRPNEGRDFRVIKLMEHDEYVY